ncbi:MAG: ATP-binding protein, partial [Bacilli bacterium]|nr:ATP-binding protein [Bacilli bacterium]
GDKNKLKTIINNLLSNAVKYTEKGHIDFTVDCINNEDKCNLRITISDTGRGIRNDQKEFLFTKFYRLEEDKDSDIEGTGLGLAITKSLVELMNGEINVNSTEGMGTTFMVTINQGLIDSSSKVEETEVL